MQQRTTALAARNHALALLGVAIVVGACLRLLNIGALGFRWDEDLSSLAVQAVLEHGIPLLPSGMIYPRGGVFLYMMAASADWLGFSELALRLPAALFGIALIPLAYAFGRALFDVRVGLIVACLIAISQWDVEFARYARMYAPFTVLYVLTLLCIWKYRMQRTSGLGSAACVALAVAAISLHQLGYTLVAAFFFPLVLRGPAAWRKPRAWLYPAAAAGVTATFFFAWAAAEARWMWRPVEAAGAMPPAALESAGQGLLRRMPLLAGLLDAAPLVVLALAAAGMIAAVCIMYRTTAPPLHRSLLLAIAGLCVAQLFNVALLALLALTFLKREGLAGFGARDVRLAIVLVAGAFVAWLAMATVLGLASPQGGLKTTVRSLLDYPHFFVFWAYAREWPMASIVAAIGALWAFDRAARPALGAGANEAAASGFLLLALGTPLVANGLFDTGFELFRYTVPFNTLYFALVALALVHWRAVAAALPPRARDFAPTRRAGVAFMALLVLAFDLNPLRAWLVTQRDYANDGLLYRAFALDRYPDFKTPADHVARNKAGEDLVVVLDSREYYNYLGHIDYWVRTAVYETQTYQKDGVMRDLYVDTPLIMTVRGLQEVLAEPGRTKWLLASDSMLAATRAVSGDVKQFIREQHSNVVYTGRDRDTRVYRFD